MPTLQTVHLPQAPLRRYGFSFAYVDGSGFCGNFGSWLNENECRRAVARLLRDPRIDQSSINVLVHEKTTKWKRAQFGPASQVFPDIQLQFERETAIEAVLSDPNLHPEVRRNARSAIGTGIPQAIELTKQLLAVLERLQLQSRGSRGAPSSKAALGSATRRV